MRINIWPTIGISWSGALGVIVATLVLYSVFVLVLRFVGPRLAAGGSTLSVALMTLLGALTARGMLGNQPTLGGALVVLTTLFVLESMLGHLRDMLTSHARHRPPSAVTVMVEGRIDAQALRRRGLTQAQFYTRLRESGVRHLDDVKLVILERRGGLTIVRQGEVVSPELFADVDGLDDVASYNFSSSSGVK